MGFMERLPWDIEEIAKYLEKLADSDVSIGRLQFIEPNLSFNTDTNHSLNIVFSAESVPPWTTHCNNGFQNNYTINFCVTPTDLHQAALSLRNQLMTFPVRGMKNSKRRKLRVKTILVD